MSASRRISGGLACLVLLAGCHQLVGWEPWEERDASGDWDGGMGGGSQGGGGGGGRRATYGQRGQSCRGMKGNECGGKNCCAALRVPGGTFRMGRYVPKRDAGTGADAARIADEYEGAGEYEEDELPEHEATVDEFWLDKFEVTVGRFRAFVRNYHREPPPQGAGRYKNVAATGWNPFWEKDWPKPTELSKLLGEAPRSTWTEQEGIHENDPINSVTWAEAQAFCIWDGGRLPTEAEWEFAAACGDENRLFPWGNQLDSTNGNLVNANLGNGAEDGPYEVNKYAEGMGCWGHMQLAGNVAEYVLDAYDKHQYQKGKCDRCCATDGDGNRVIKGGSFRDEVIDIRAAARSGHSLDSRDVLVGFRCAYDTSN